MKRDFKAEMQVVRFGAEDVIATSGVVTLSNFGDKVATNNTFSFGGNSYVFVKNDGSVDNDSYHTFRSALAGYVGDENLEDKDGGSIKFGGLTLNEIYKQNVPDFDGEYTYDGPGLYTFSKKQ